MCLRIICFCLFDLSVYVSVNIYGHGERVRSPSHRFSFNLASMTKRFTNTSGTSFVMRRLLARKCILDNLNYIVVRIVALNTKVKANLDLSIK